MLAINLLGKSESKSKSAILPRTVDSYKKRARKQNRFKIQFYMKQNRFNVQSF